MFSSKSIALFFSSIVLITLSYLFMAFDPEPNGFGMLTLWLAPPLLLIGFLLPIPGIIGLENISTFTTNSKKWFTWKNAFGILAFLIAFTTYMITLEPTASLWDCSEFIASAYKLQVPHTPGTPLSLLIGRVFSMFSFDKEQVAWTINMMSAFFSALSVALLYNIIHFFGEKLIPSTSRWRKQLLITGAMGGSLCLAFSDTFWFSAVEAEIYGVACFFILLILWMIVKGKDLDEPLRSRMLILVGYMSGLAYCIHPMCLLVLPILPFAWWTHNKVVNLKAILATIIAGAALVFVINRFVAIGIFDLTFMLDHFAVNTLGLPFYSGIIILLILVTGVSYFMLRKFDRYKSYTWAILFLILGFTPYLMLFIRSNQNPPIDETNPEDLYQIKTYMNRESYGSVPLLFGPYFDADVAAVTTKGPAYYKDVNDYKIAGTKVDYRFDPSRETILPRLYSRDPNHIAAYRQWLGLKEKEKPNFADNIKFLFTYQLGHMYGRYLLWNFAGRESDIQDSNWLRPWDRLSHGSNERGRNQYWMVPLLLGLFGAFAQFQKDRNLFVINTTIFLFTGLILATYLNSPPIEPRERDYIYVASYIAFTVWIGLGIIAIGQQFINDKLKLISITVLSIVLPLWMLYQNYDDHDRSGRTFQMDYARVVLNSCAPNAVLFTGGDNDTFPLWYLQDVENFRTDVRVMVLSYFNTDWYINQLRRPYYQSPPVKFSLDEKDYRQYGLNDVLYIDDRIKEGIDAVQYLKMLHEEHPALRLQGNNDDEFNILPSRVLKIKNTENPSKELSLEVTGNFLEKNALAILDIIVSNEWKRPLCFNFTSMNTLGMDIKPYLVQEGLVYRLMPDRSDKGPAVNTTLTYKNLIGSSDFSNLANPKVNFNYEDFYVRMITPLRQSFNALAEALLKEGDTTQAENVLIYTVEKLHYPHLPPSFTDLHTADMLMALGKIDDAKSLTTHAFNFYYDQVRSQMTNGNSPDGFDLFILRQSTALLKGLGETSYVNKFDRLGL